MLFHTVPISAKPPLIVPSEDYPTIQAAVDAANKGDVIQVLAGVYYENVVIDEEVTLIGANKDTTIIDGTQFGNVIHVQASGVTITGFTIRNGNNGIRVMGTIGNVNVEGNIIKNNRYGISLIGDEVTSTTDNIISGNTFQNNSNVSISITKGLSNTINQNDISGSAYGMKLFFTDTTTISDNLLTSNSYGIYIYYSTGADVINNTGIDNSFGIYAVRSDNIFIRDNKINGSTYGIQLYESYSSTILYNDVSDNPSFGIYLTYSNTTSVTNNTMSRNDWGFTLYNSSSNTIEGNTISYNTFGIATAISSGNTIYHNNLINNVDQITRDGASANTWSQNGEGNYWSDYQGVDDGSGERVAGDGIGDTLIPHLSVDNYPLMNTWPDPTPDIAILAIYESTSIAYIGQIVNFEVIVKNEGNMTETFNVTLQTNVTIIENTTVIDLAPRTNASLFFNWNTSTVLPGYYLISATAEPLPTEIDLEDNSKDDGTINLKTPLLGDINTDFTVNNDDLTLLNQAYGATSTSPNWNSDADLNKDDLIDVLDLYLLSKNYGKTV